MVTLENPILRLILLRLVPPFSTSDAQAVVHQVREIFRRNAPERTVVFADVRGSYTFEPSVEQIAVELIQDDSSTVDSSGILYTKGGAYSPNIVGAIRAGGADRRIATADRESLLTWFRERVDASTLWEIQHFIRRGDELEAILSTQAQVVQTEKMAALGRMVAGIAHEINNPVNFIASGLPLICDDFHEMAERVPPDQRDEDYEASTRRFAELARAVEEGADRTIAIIEGLRTFSRVDEAEVKAIDLHDSLDSTLRLLAHELRDGITVVRQYGNLPQVECYAGELNQVFMNLLVNAIQAIDGEGTVTIRTATTADGQVRIAIRDTGVGMEKHVMQRLFDPFFTTKPVGVGTGLGLAISHGIVERHQGTISVESQVGVGSELVVTLPLGVTPAPSSSAAG